MRRNSLLIGAASLALGLSTARAGAAVFASSVVSYDPGSAVSNDGFLNTFTRPASATGAPDPITGEGNGFPNVLNPFSPAYEDDEIVLVGEGGHLTLRLPNYVNVGPGLEIGVISNAGLQDASFFGGGSPGTNYPTAKSFSGGVAEVRVSENGTSWVSLGKVTFNLPTNYYTNVTDPYQESAPSSPQAADFGKPFDGTLSMFDGENFTQTIATLDGSGGGTWLDLSNRGLTRVGYVEFIVSDDTPNVIDRLGIDAVVIANGKAGAPVQTPEPGGALTVGGAILLLRRRHSRRIGG